MGIKSRHINFRGISTKSGGSLQFYCCRNDGFYILIETSVGHYSTGMITLTVLGNRLLDITYILYGNPTTSDYYIVHIFVCGRITTFRALISSFIYFLFIEFVWFALSEFKKELLCLIASIQPKQHKRIKKKSEKRIKLKDFEVLLECYSWHIHLIIYKQA